MIPVETGLASPNQTGGGWRRLATRLGIDLRPGEGRAAIFLFLCFFLFVTFQYTTKAVRQSSYIDGLGAANLPWVFLTVALCSYPFLRIYSLFADRVSRQHLLAATCGIVATSMVAFWWLFQYLDQWKWIPFVLYVWMSIVYVMNYSQFWSFSNHIFDPRQAKRLFGFIGAGGLLGGIAGGQVAKLVSYSADTRTIFLVAAGILLMAGVLVYIAHRYRPSDAAAVGGTMGLVQTEKVKSGFAAIKSSRQLQWITAIMVLMTVVAQVVDLQFNWAVQEATSSLDDATRFFGNFFSIMGVAAFLFQLAFTSRIHKGMGVGVAMRILPVAMAVGSSAVLGAYYFVPRMLMSSALLVKVGENGLRYSLEQSTRELLFLPVPSNVRVKGKAFIDVFVQRGAKGLAALLLLPVTPAIALISPPVLAGWIAFPLIAIWLIVTIFAYREYVGSFRRSLGERQVEDGHLNIRDSKTLALLVQALGSSDRRQVMQSLDILDANNRTNLVPPLLLYHDDPEVRHRTLVILAKSGRVDAAPLIEKTLQDEDPEVRAEAIQVLAKLHGKDACDLMLPRLVDSSASVRAAAVACLANHGNEAMVEEATATLSMLLTDSDPVVRTEAAKALGAIQEPQFQEKVIQLLYDRNIGVVRETITSIRRRVARDGFNPLYLPTLISLLQSRRIKHEAREALVAFGEPALPALNHFMSDRDEPVWVRRALPKTVAKIGTLAAATALVDQLAVVEDDFQRRRLIEALGSLPDDIRHSVDGRVIEEQIYHEVCGHLQVMVDLRALGMLDKGRFDGPCVTWSSDVLDPSLVERLLAERLEVHLRNLFGLMVVMYPPRDIWAAFRSLTSRQPALRTHALEYLDNTLAGEVRRNVFAVIGDQTMEQKLHEAERQFGAVVRTKVATLDRLLAVSAEGESDENHLTLATLYTIHTDRVTELYERVKNMVEEDNDPFVNETAGWVADRLGLLPSS
jgi:AAA family ATP:ADP antiporter